MSDNFSSSLKSADWVIWTPVAIAVAIACGAVLGVALGPAGVWLSLGLALGVTAGVMFAEYHLSRRMKESKGSGNSQGDAGHERHDRPEPDSRDWDAYARESRPAAPVEVNEVPTRVMPEVSPESLSAAPEPAPVRKPRTTKAAGASKAAAPRKTAVRKTTVVDSDPIV